LQDGIVLLFILPRAERALGKNCGAIYACFLFSIIHLPSPIFSISSFILIATLIVVWRKYHSLIAVALIHGILGALANKTLLFSMRIGKAGLSL
jgi:membrane protease YdiL (CAAX protease family)